MTRTCLVIGGGIFGVTAALELHRRGWQVRLFDPSPTPRTVAASTDISKVVRPDYGADAIYVAMADAALDGWHAWNGRWGTPLYHQDGFLLLSREAMAPGGFEYESYRLLERTGHILERLDAHGRCTRFPAWPQDQYPDGYLNPRAGWVESGRVLEQLTDEARATGVELRENARVTRLLERGSRVVGIEIDSKDEFLADIVLAAVGAWTPALISGLDTVMWTTGQPVVHFKVDRPADWQAPRFPVWAADIARTGWYGFPALDDGTLKIGHHAAGRRVHPDEPRGVRPEELARFRAFVEATLPALATAPIVGSRLCLYCDTFDGDFWIDHDPARRGLVVAAGDSGHGFKFAPILGPLIADVVEGRPNAWATQFRWRERVHDSKEAARAIDAI